MKFNIKYIALIFSFFCCLEMISAQNKPTNNTNDSYVLEKDSLKAKDKIFYNFEMGVGMDNNGNFSTFYKPSLSYQISPKFTINTGLMYVNSSANNFPIISDYSYHAFSGNIAQYYAFVEGEYQLNDKLIIGGSIFYDFVSFDNFNGLQNNTTRNALDNIGYSANFKYKLTKNISIEGEFRVGGNNNPFNNHSYSPFDNQFHPNYGNSPFLTW